MPVNLKKKAEEIQQRFGGVPTEIPPPRNLLEETESLLANGHGDLTLLDRRHRKVIPHVLWSSPQRWSENQELVDAYLAWADNNWSSAPRRLWRHYLVNLNPQSYAIQRLSCWLADRRDRLKPVLLGFSERWALFDPTGAIQRVIDSLLAGRDFLSEVEQLNIAPNVVRQSAFLLSVLEALGRHLLGYRQPSTIAKTLKKLLAPLGETPTYKMQGPKGLQQVALKSLVEGLVTWAERSGGPVVDETRDLLDVLIGDPRLDPTRWLNIDSGVKQTVERWLTKISLQAFFKVFRVLATAKPNMVNQRQQFWQQYFGNISRAWLITGVKGRSTATQLLGKSFGSFETGASSDHCALMIQIGNLVIFEMNYNGGTLFWSAGDGAMPGFYQSAYDRAELRDLCSTVPRFRMTHQGNWQSRYETEIRRRTGV